MKIFCLLISDSSRKGRDSLFTGIVEEIGTVRSIQNGHLSSRLTIDADVVLEDVHEGDSICVNGVCLTVTSYGKGVFTADVMGETLRRSSLGALIKGSHVNLERALSLTSRLGGHIVSGHIDATGTIVSVRKEATAHWFTIEASDKLLRYIVEKGSIAIDGISLTVASVDEKSFQVSIIPHTSQHTTLLEKKAGDIVNLECDLIGKYVEKLMQKTKEEPNQSSTGLTTGFLAQHGFL